MSGCGYSLHCAEVIFRRPSACAVALVGEKKNTQSTIANRLSMASVFCTAGPGGLALPAHQVSNHPHGHQAGERAHLRGGGPHPEDCCRGNTLPQAGA